MSFNTNWIPQTANGTSGDIIISNKINLQNVLRKQDKNITSETAFHKTIFLRFLLENFYTALLQYSGLMISVLLPLPAPFSFATGTACSFIFLRGYRVLPGIFLGSWFAYLNIYSLWSALIFGVLFSCFVGLFYKICLSFRYPTLIFYRNQDIKFFFLIAVCITSIYCAIGTFYLEIPWTSFYRQWLFNLFANLNGILLFATAILIWDARSLEFLAWNKHHQWFAVSTMIVSLMTIIAAILVLQPNCLYVCLLCLIFKRFFCQQNALLIFIALCLLGAACNFSHYFNFYWLQQQSSLNLIVLQAITLILTFTHLGSLSRP